MNYKQIAIESLEQLDNAVTEGREITSLESTDSNERREIRMVLRRMDYRSGTMYRLDYTYQSRLFMAPATSELTMTESRESCADRLCRTLSKYGIKQVHWTKFGN